MKALVLEEYNKLVYKDVPDPEIHSNEVLVKVMACVTRELQVLGSCAIRGEYEVVLNLLETGKISVDDQISTVAPLSEGAIWFNKLYRKEDELSKVILVP